MSDWYALLFSGPHGKRPLTMPHISIFACLPSRRHILGVSDQYIHRRNKNPVAFHKPILLLNPPPPKLSQHAETG